MNRIYDFYSFLNEKKKFEKPKEQVIEEIEKDAKKVATEMFDKTRNIQFEYDKNGLPSKISFGITEVDYNLKYENGPPMFIEYSENVLKKRTYKVELTFAKKKKDKISDKNIKYTITFNIKLTPTEKVKPKKDDYYIVWEFDKKPKKLYEYLNSELKIRHSTNVKWQDNKLKIKKSFWDKLDKDYAKKLIEEDDGIKLGNEEI